MTAKTEAQPAYAHPHAHQPAHKPGFALFLATAGGFGYLPKAPGTWGSLVGLVPAVLPWLVFLGVNAALGSPLSIGPVQFAAAPFVIDPFLFYNVALFILIAATGVWASGVAARFWHQKDPQRVVIDEVSGQHLVLLLGCGLPVSAARMGDLWTSFPFGLITVHSPVNWKYLLAGFILFRVFDIWKPFPIRRLERLHGGWGVMTDDWLAGIYAGLLLWFARSLGL
jgi:phosphatidylglycerophosphatase A